MNRQVLRLKILVAGLLCRPAVGVVIGRVFRNRIPSFGIVVDTSDDQFSDTVKAMLFWGIYESAEIRFVKRYLRSDLDVIELGSSLGITSMHIKRKVGTNKKAVFVEANRELIPILRQNVGDGIDASSSVVNAAVWDTDDGTIPLRLDERTFGSSVANGGWESVATMSEVPVVRLSDVVRSHVTHRFALVSDIEGAEAQFIFGDAGALARCDQLIIELHDTRYFDRDVTIGDLRRALLVDHGYEVVAERGPVLVLER